MMKSILALLFVAFQLHGASAFFLNTAALTPPSLRSIPFVGRRGPNNSNAKSVAQAPPAVVSEDARKSSLEEFNSIMQQVVEEERREHYYPYLATAGRR